MGRYASLRRRGKPSFRTSTPAPSRSWRECPFRGSRIGAPSERQRLSPTGERGAYERGKAERPCRPMWHLVRGGCGCRDSAYGRASALSAEAKPDTDLAATKKSYGRHVEEIDRELRGLLISLSCCCAARLSEICDGRKTAKFPAGVVRWKRRPPRIKVWDETSAMRALRKEGMESFLRSRTYVFCGEILRDRDTALDLRGVEVGRVGEEFVVRLFGARL